MKTLQSLSVHAFLDFLEAECAMLVTLVMRNSPYWEGARRALLESIRNMIDDKLTGDRGTLVRGKIFKEIIGGRYPTSAVCNGHSLTPGSEGPSLRLGSASFDEDEDSGEANSDLDKMKHHGRRCCSPCCAGAFVVEAMLATLVHFSTEELVFPDGLAAKVYRRKLLGRFLFVDVPSVLHHYILSLDRAEETEGDDARPGLKVLSLGSNLGPLDSQLANEGILRSYVETRRYYDFPWRFSDGHSRASTDFFMLTLCRLFSRPADYFNSLTTIVLSGECLNTRVGVSGAERDGRSAAVQIMAGIAYSCPVLETLDLTAVSSLSPECLIYLFYQDAFSLLHKYMYLPETVTSNDGKISFRPSLRNAQKHSNDRYCPWCDDPDASNGVRDGCEFFLGNGVHLLDDRLFDFVEGNDFAANPLPPSSASPGGYLALCVRVGDTIRALSDPVYELDRSVMGEDEVLKVGQECIYRTKQVTTRSSLCSTLRRLLLPSDAVDSRTWLVPLALAATNNLESLGNCLLLEGVHLARQLGLEESLKSLENITELCVSLEGPTWMATREKLWRRTKSLQSLHAHWSIFCGQAAAARGPFSLKHFIEERMDVVDASDLDAIKCRWKETLVNVPVDHPRLRKLKISVQPAVLCCSDRDALWEPLTRLTHLRELHVASSSWADALSLLLAVGKNIKKLSLTGVASLPMLSVFGGPDEPGLCSHLNTVAWLCPELEDLQVGQPKDESPHAIYTGPRPDVAPRPGAFSRLTHLHLVGNITLEAFQFVWESALCLENLKIEGHVVSSSEEEASEVVLGRERVDYLLTLNGMRKLEILDVSLTLSCIEAARTLLDALPKDMERLATLNVKVSIPESLEGQSFGDLVSSVLARMADFKSACLSRGGNVEWNWRREGILTILLQQQMLLSFSDLIDP